MPSTRCASRYLWKDLALAAEQRSEGATAKRLGQFFTPPEVAASLVKWAVRSRRDRVLDPSCGNGEFLALHETAVGVEMDAKHMSAARERAPSAEVHHADFFLWAEQASSRFDAVVGNPPFIRYQGFCGSERDRALRIAARIGACLPRLTSSWAPFVAGAASLLKKGGRLAFVVPAEIGHAGYARSLLRALTRNFGLVELVAIREKLFPDLSEDTWLLYAEGFGCTTTEIRLAAVPRFEPSLKRPAPTCSISVQALEKGEFRLRSFLLPAKVRSAYESLEESLKTARLGNLAQVSIGYVTGANDFFHLRPSVASELGVPAALLRPAVRRGEFLPAAAALRNDHVERWLQDDAPILLLHLKKDSSLPSPVVRYLNSAMARSVKANYKCRSRTPWYAVPDVKVPDGFLSYMTGGDVALVRNEARCVATNSLHVVTMKNGHSIRALQRAWEHPLVTLSCELEGHPLGGGLLKLEPREAQRVVVPRRDLRCDQGLSDLLREGITTMREWRHYAQSR